MALHALSTPRYIRKTELNPNEYHKNFRQIDDDILDAVTSPAAAEVTDLMSKIYLRLRRAPTQYWEKPGVIFIRGELREGKWVNGWKILCEIVGVSSETANKAFDWLHEEAIIGYDARKNNAGIRIFINRAANSIGLRAVPNGPALTAPPAQKVAPATTGHGARILTFAPASRAETPASPAEAPFKEDTENTVEIVENPHAPNTAKTATTRHADAEQNSPKVTVPETVANAATVHPVSQNPAPATTPTAQPISLEELTNHLRRELQASFRQDVETLLRQQIPQLVSQAQSRETERTRQWFNDSALPKAIRVAQREAYQILRQDFNLREREARSQANGAVGQTTTGPDADEVPRVQPLNAEETRELAEICVSLYETQKQPLAATLRQLSVGQGGPLTAADEPRVAACARQLLAATIAGALPLSV